MMCVKENLKNFPQGRTSRTVSSCAYKLTCQPVWLVGTLCLAVQLHPRETTKCTFGNFKPLEESLKDLPGLTLHFSVTDRPTNCGSLQGKHFLKS